MDDFFKKVTSSRFYSFGDKLGDIMIASVWWVLCSLPIVTFIPSTIALYYTCNKSKSTELSMTKLFFKSFRSNFKQGFIINIIYIIYSIIPASSIFFGYFGIGDVKLPDGYFPFSFITLIPIIFTLPFVIALVARFDNDIKTTFKNAFTLSALNLGSTLIIWIIMILSLALMIVFPPSLLLVPMLACKLIIPRCEKIFGIANKVEESRNNPDINDEDSMENSESEEYDFEEDEEEIDEENEIDE